MHLICSAPHGFFLCQQERKNATRIDHDGIKCVEFCMRMCALVCVCQCVIYVCAYNDLYTVCMCIYLIIPSKTQGTREIPAAKNAANRMPSACADKILKNNLMGKAQEHCSRISNHISSLSHIRIKKHTRIITISSHTFASEKDSRSHLRKIFFFLQSHTSHERNRHLF
jgi:hypothetical protein